MSLPPLPRYPGRAEQLPPETYRGFRWGTAIPVALVVGGAGIPLAPLLLFLYWLVVPAYAVALAVTTTVCLGQLPANPRRDAVGLGVTLAPVVTALPFLLLLHPGS